MGFSAANFTVINFYRQLLGTIIVFQCFDGQEVSALAIGGTTVLHGRKENAETHAVKFTAK
ncbi:MULTISPECIES: hypothetical protein [unclassified Mesorhizobium]|uniref:hypothetical protein n=1 Tax=unclassified Mesorhizobium TaxID=325217 RepID=UPI000FE6B61C|nr:MULTISPECIES: hypothetical protein [unclassified Mesorhizobium]RWG91906.1 MAG: hypothetical protein EOQ68_04820 [Mesorhizobium sp.]RWH05966.1 MAG: hypothetical protein EOQ73_06755 [Mesorhizobium sp.]RWI26314.1 MAG: hypothetical protein EOQ94_12340 [Mesorhizobium sp.]